MGRITARVIYNGKQINVKLESDRSLQYALDVADQTLKFSEDKGITDLYCDGKVVSPNEIAGELGKLDITLDVKKFVNEPAKVVKVAVEEKQSEPEPENIVKKEPQKPAVTKQTTKSKTK